MAVAPRKVTLKMLAHEAEVDVSTVSRALSNDPRVKPETRERIQKLAKKFSYRPNLAARHLVAGRTHTILFLMSALDNPFEREIVNPAAALLHEGGYDMLTAFCSFDPEMLNRMLNRLRQGVADGAFLIPRGDEDPESLREFHRDNRPLILIDRDVPHSGASLVTTDNADASAELVRRCYDAGCRKFIVEFHLNNTVSRLRQSAAIAEIMRLNASLLSLPDQANAPALTEPWAIISNSQGDVLRCLSACPQEWLQQPLCFGVFDQWIGEPYPARTTFVAVQDFQRLGREATGLMLRMLDAEQPNPEQSLICIPAKEFLTIHRNY